MQNINYKNNYSYLLYYLCPFSYVPFANSEKFKSDTINPIWNHEAAFINHHLMFLRLPDHNIKRIQYMREFVVVNWPGPVYLYNLQFWIKIW